MILSIKRKILRYCNWDVLGIEVTADSMLCPELNAYIDTHRRSEIIVIKIEREITRFDLMELADE
jgi:hypothetical protein